MQRNRRRQFGQGMTEYIIIVALIAIAAIAAYAFFGKTLRSNVAGMAQEMSGQKADTGLATEAAKGAKGEAEKDKGLSNYGSAK